MCEHVTHDTIAAISTAPGRAGVAVIRISGVHAALALNALGVSVLPPPRKARLKTFVSAESKEVIDTGLVLWFPGPDSFTGEDVAELQVHGSRAVLDALMSALTRLPGVRMAEPGEFARRAFFNNKMDLLQAEGLADLIDAETEAQRAQALKLMEGDASRRYTDLRNRAITALAHMEAYIDFPDEDIPDSIQAQIGDDIKRLKADVESLLMETPVAERIRDGVTVAILGAPNAGKSSLLNALARRDAAITSEEAGTTRDVLEVHMRMRGYAVTLLDTAGLREADNAVEQEGIRRALERAERADVKLLVFDATQLPDLDASTLALASENTIIVLNKMDMVSSTAPTRINNTLPLLLSVKTKKGIAELEQELADQVASIMDRGASELPMITRSRHRVALQEASLHLSRACTRLPTELQCEELRQSANAIGRITGKIAVDELLDHIFLEFCIGK